MPTETRLKREPPKEATRYPTDIELLRQVLCPYLNKRCQYLKSAELEVAGDPADGGRISASCEFEIPESCYIDDTGHFNSVEFNICYNQMLYYAVAKCVQDGLAHPFTRWTMDDYWTRQLPDFLITDFRSAFKHSMRGRVFRGEFEISDIAEWEGSDIRDALVVLHTSCRYWDSQGGWCHGEVRIAITHPPTEAAPDPADE